MASTTGRQGNVDSVGTKGPQVAHVPDTDPYPSKVGPASVKGGEQFEAVDYAAVTAREHEGGQSLAGNSKTVVHAGGSGIGQKAPRTPNPSLADKAMPRGHSDASGLFMAQKGHAPTRSPGKKTQASDIDKLKTAGA